MAAEHQCGCSKEQAFKIAQTGRLNAPETLKPGEVYVTHHNVSNEIDCAHALAALGCSEVVLVGEGLTMLEAEYNQVLGEQRETVPHPEDLEVILNSLKSEEAANCFSRFAHAIYKGSKSSADKHVRAAISRTGARLFWDVAKHVAAKFPANFPLHRMLSSEEARFQMIRAWSHVFTLRTERHIMSHPYDVIAGDSEMGARALEVLVYMSNKYQESKEEKRRNLGQLLQASLPFVEASVARYNKERRSREEEEESEVETMKQLLLLPSRVKT